MSVQFYSSPQAEADAIRRAAKRAGSVVHSIAFSPTAPHVRADVDCGDGWGAARYLVALAAEDAETVGARVLAGAVLGARPDPAKLHAWIKSRVRFAPECGEIFQSGAETLRSGVGDCDDHARLAYALAKASGIPVEMAFLSRPHGQPSHVTTLLDGQWAETTVDAAFGEFPLYAARRLGLEGVRLDIAAEVTPMTDSDLDLPPVPSGFDDRNPIDELGSALDELRTLGFLGPEPVGCASDPALREAVANYQRAAGLYPIDGLLGPDTRAHLSWANGGIGALTGASSRISDEFLRAVFDMANRFAERGAHVTPENFLSVWLSESGISSVANHAGFPFYGLNQMGVSQLKAAGWIDPAPDFVGLSILQQLPYVERYYINAVNGGLGGDFSKLNGVGGLYLATAAPAYLAHADDDSFPLYKRNPNSPDPSAPASEWAAWMATPAGKADPYGANRGLDADHKGFISVGDLSRRIANAQQGAGAFWIDLRRRVLAMSDGGAPSRVGGVVAGVAVLLGTAASIYYGIRS